ncbi:MAG: Fur family transcriptional regulator [Anaerolineae bacterium]
MACEQAFAQLLKRHGLRMTPQRGLVLQALHDAPGYASADEILSRVHRISAAVDVSTVYRTLDLLREFGLVAAVDAADGQTRYDLLGLNQPHLHLVCQGCGGIFVVPMSSADALLAGLLAQHGFQATLDDVTIPGLCAACRSSSTDASASTAPEDAGRSPVAHHAHSL